MTFNFQEIKNALLDSTPICDDAINIILNMVKPPSFEVGKTYYKICISNMGTLEGIVKKFKVIKKTKCFVTIKETNEFNNNKPMRKKICIYRHNDEEYIRFTLDNTYLDASNEWIENIHTIVYNKHKTPSVVKK